MCVVIQCVQFVLVLLVCLHINVVCFRFCEFVFVFVDVCALCVLFLYSLLLELCLIVLGVVCIACLGFTEGCIIVLLMCCSLV